MIHLPLRRLLLQLRGIHLNSVARGKLRHDFMILLVAGGSVVDGDAEAVCQRELLLHGISAVLVRKVRAVPVMEALADQVSAVARRINQDIGRLLLQAALDHRLQILVLRLVLLEGKIIHIQNELVVPVLDAGDHVVEIAELIAAHLNDAKAPLIILVRDGLDAGGFAGSCLAVEQTVVGRLSLHKGLGVLDQLLLRDFVPDKVLHVNVQNVLHRHDPRLSRKLSGLIVLDPECLVQSEHADTVLLVELREEILHLFGAACRFELPGQRADAVPDSRIVGLAPLSGGLIIQNYR